MPTQIESRYPYTEDGEIFWPLDAPWPDPWVTLGAMGAATRELRLATNIYLAGLRDPFTAAKAAGTAAVLSGNRIVCGVAAGWIAEEYAMVGIDFASRGRRLDEQLAVMRKLWSGREVDHHGEFFDFEHALLCPAPSEPIPIWVGGASPPALRRAARNDGWFGVPMSVEQIVPFVETLRREREAAGRAWEGFEISISLAEAQTPDNTAELEELGVGSLCVIAPWVPSPWGSTSWFDEKADPGKLDSKQFAMERFAEAVVRKFG
jgi:probable F420-dependent oxidoreductase